MDTTQFFLPKFHPFKFYIYNFSTLLFLFTTPYINLSFYDLNSLYLLKINSFYLIHHSQNDYQIVTF